MWELNYGNKLPCVIIDFSHSVTIENNFWTKSPLSYAKDY